MDEGYDLPGEGGDRVYQITAEEFRCIVELRSSSEVLREEVDSLSRQLQEERARVRRATSTTAILEAQRDEAKQELADETRRTDEARRAAMAAARTLREARDETESAKQELDKERSLLSGARQENEDLRAASARLESEIEFLRDKTISQQLADDANKAAELEALVSARADAERHRASEESLAREVDELRTALARIDAIDEALRARASDSLDRVGQQCSAEEVARLLADLASSRAEVTQLELDLQRAVDRTRELEEACTRGAATREQELAAADARIREADALARARSREADDLRAARDELDALVRALQLQLLDERDKQASSAARATAFSHADCQTEAVFGPDHLLGHDHDASSDDDGGGGNCKFTAQDLHVAAERASALAERRAVLRSTRVFLLSFVVSIIIIILSSFFAPVSSHT